jgi:hypothetical protein
MKKTSLIITVIYLFAFSVSLLAQTTTKEITDKFFELYQTQPSKAFDYAFGTNHWDENQQDAVFEVKNKLKNITSQCGTYFGFEMLTEKTAGTTLKVVSFVLKYDREPIRFIFLFYKPNDAWRVMNLTFDEDLDLDLKEAARPYRVEDDK